jgi:hypothetical protein
MVTFPDNHSISLIFFVSAAALHTKCCFGWQADQNTPRCLFTIQRRDFTSTLAKTVAATWVAKPLAANSSNLPSSTGADLSKCGTVETLIPILDVERSLMTAKSTLNTIKSSNLTEEQVQQISFSLEAIPSEEVKFKRLFDEYSDPVSYKQKYMDQNAFLVYYSKGFDGPNRPSIESGEVPKQTLQYGARNDAWSAFDDLSVELRFARKDGSTANDIAEPLDRVTKALNAYLTLVPSRDLEQGRKVSSPK